MASIDEDIALFFSKMMKGIDDYFSSNEFKQYLQTYEQAGPEAALLDSEVLTDIADHYRSHGLMDKALQAVDFALSLYPGATAPLIFTARLALASNDAEAANKYLDSITDQTDLDFYYMRAEVMIAQDKVVDANIYLEEKIDEINEEDYNDYVLDVAALYGDYDLTDLADEWLSRSDETELDDYRELRGRILMAKGEIQKAREIFEALVEKVPFSVIYWNLLACAQYMQKDYHESITSSEYAIAIDPLNEEALLNKANALSLLGSYKEAMPYYEKYTEVSKNTDVGEMYQGITLSNMQKPTEAIPHLEKALATSSDDSSYLSDIYNELVLALMQTGHNDEALRYVTEAEKRDFNPNEMKVLHGHLLLMQGNKDEAQRYFKEAYFESGIAPNIVMRIANSLYDCGYISMSYDLLHTLLENEDENITDGFSQLAACAYALGKHEEFIKYLKLAVDRNPAEARFILSDMFPAEMEPENYYEYAKKELI